MKASSESPNIQDRLAKIRLVAPTAPRPQGAIRATFASGPNIDKDEPQTGGKKGRAPRAS